MKIPFYEHHNYDNNFPIIFHYDTITCHKHSPYFPQWHEALELLYFKNGAAHLSLDNEKIDAFPGEIIVINSDVVHNITTECEKCNYYCLIIDKKFIEKSGFPIGEKRIVTKLCDKEIISQYDGIISAISKNNAYYSQEALGYVYIMLSKLYLNCSYNAENILNSGAKDKVEIIKKALTYIRENFQNNMTLESISAHCHMSKFYFCRTFSEVTGITAIKFINTVRCEYARELLQSGEYSVSEISGMCGFESASYFTKIFKNFYGVTPNSYKKTDRG